MSISRERVVRVFVSSTFRDMQDERNELVKFVFPELKRRCRKRRVEFIGVDLRWGITDEQKAEGKVLPFAWPKLKGAVLSLLEFLESDTGGFLMSLTVHS